MANIEVIEAGFAFSKLIVYQKSKVFYSGIKELIKLTELNKLHKDQLLRAALSIPLNIAESSGRNGPKDRRRFLVIARGSLFECVSLIDVLLSDKSIDSKEASKILKEANEISKMLFVMAENLKDKKTVALR